MHFLKIVLKLSDFKAQMGAKIVGFHFKGIFLIDPPLIFQKFRLKGFLLEN